MIGTIPDIISLPENYLQLQKIYKDEASKDRVIFQNLLKEILGERELPIPDERI